MNDKLNRVDYKVNRKEKSPEKPPILQMAKLYSIVFLLILSCLVIGSLSIQVNYLKQQNKMLRIQVNGLKQQNKMLKATNESLQRLLKIKPRPK